MLAVATARRRGERYETEFMNATSNGKNQLSPGLTLSRGDGSTEGRRPRLTTWAQRPVEISMPPNLMHPSSLFDLLNFRVSEFYSVSGSLVTRLCEGEFGVTREEWGFIAMLAALGPLSPSDLSAWTSVDRSQGSRTLRGLSDKKLIIRRRVAGDGRRVKVELTEAGRELYRQVFPQVVKIHQAMLATLDETEIATLARCLRKMQEAATVVYGSTLVEAQADRRNGGSRSTWLKGRAP